MIDKTEREIESIVSKYYSRIPWDKDSDEIWMFLCTQTKNNPAIMLHKDILENVIAKHKMTFEKKVNAAGGLDMTTPIGPQDLQYLNSNEFDKLLGSHFLLASSDNWNTTATYWINKDNTVTILKLHKPEIITQLCSAHILDEVLWPEFERERQLVLDKMNTMCPFDINTDLVKWPWGHMSNFANEFQDSMSSWILEHFIDRTTTLKFKAIPNKDDNGTVLNYTITEFTDIFPQLSKDMFISTFNKNIDTLCGRYSKRLPQHPLPYSNKTGDFSFIKLDMESFIQAGECPLWDLALRERLDSEEECEVFRAAIWQVYDPDNKSRQVIYMYDPHGRSGKSAMLRAAFSPIRHAQFACQKESLNNQFGFSKVWNKQLVTIGDNKNRLLLKSQIIHTMTGGDEADVEYKGQNSFMAAFHGHVWANGNVMLDIDTDAEHEVSRLVLFNIKKPKSAEKILYQFDCDGKQLLTSDGKPLLGQGDPSWEEKLKEELPYFLYKCKQDYEKYCPKHSDIVLPIAMQDRIQEDCAAINKIVFDDFLAVSVIMGNGEISDAQLRDIWKEWKENNMDRYECNLNYSDLEEHLSKLKYKCVFRKLPNGKRLRVWPNIAPLMFKKEEKSGSCNDFDL